MRILIIANNIEGDSDGIGKHARIVAEEMNRRDDIRAEIISGTTNGFSTAERMVSMEMHSAFVRAEKYVKEKCPDAVVVEYPFNEFNPIIIGDYDRLHAVCKKENCKLALSMHEYDRVRTLRRTVIEHFLKNSDIVFVSEPHYLQTLQKYNKQLYLRTIPNHIPDIGHCEKDRKGFAFFGMVNKAKAFDEMIGAWKAFNADGKYTLDIITGRDIHIDGCDKYRICMHIGENDARVAELLSSAAYAICPIKPSISYNNSSFVSACQCGCVPIGIPGEELSGMDFPIRINSYDQDAFIDAYEKAICMCDTEYERCSDEAMKFGRRFTIKATVNGMVGALNSQDVSLEDEGIEGIL